MAKYRIKEIKYRNRHVFLVQKRILFLFWKTISSNEGLYEDWHHSYEYAKQWLLSYINIANKEKKIVFFNKNGEVIH